VGKRKSSGERVLRPEAEFKGNPESEGTLRERAASAERERLLDELARCFVQAAVTRLLKEEALRRAALGADITSPP
jgi:hypothetical protein